MSVKNLFGILNTFELLLFFNSTQYITSSDLRSKFNEMKPGTLNAKLRKLFKDNIIIMREWWELEGNVESTNEIKDFLLERGADVVGVAPVDRFDDGPEETHPRHYMPDGDICNGKRVGRKD